MCTKNTKHKFLRPRKNILYNILRVTSFFVKKMTPKLKNHDYNMKLNFIYIIKCTTNKKPLKAEM